MMTNYVPKWALAALVLALGSPAWAVEPWADEGLKVTAGLELWLDAAKGDPYREGRWKDASGHRRDMMQGVPTRQPTRVSDLVVGNSASVLRFDGQDDSLLLAGPQQDYRDLTLFVVAAPKSNLGGFRAILALNKHRVNDYTSGLTLDMHAFPSLSYNLVNLEGRGFGGAADLMSDDHPLGTFHILGATLTPGAGGVKLFVDGKANGSRDRTEGLLRADELRIGVRHYSNTADPTFDQGFFEGDIAEVLVYSRVLPDEERQEVEAYLAKKHAELLKLLPESSRDGKPLLPVKDPPPVQMLVPGFTAREIPLDLTNVNNLRYREDGKLVALAYDGNIYLLSDTDRDGVEDESQLWWDNSAGSLRSPIGMALTPPDYPRGRGIFVACKGKLVLLTDTDGDDKLDKETAVASGWQELPHGVDALGVAVAKDGSVFFGLGCADFTNAYQIDKQGKAQYSLTSERGTILRVAPDLKSREIWCTGIRFPVGLSFHPAGDLFCTDQEGATWLVNGNPLDELLHVQKGRHYGFPPRHPRHLPDVIDEPSTFDYLPQHQSTCGLCFNEPLASDGPIFGPAWWRGDALVAGYTRGKIWRTKLLKTKHGYVAASQLIASLQMLTADVALSPAGELVVACHSGGPDWGTGPSGKGKLYKIRYAHRDVPQPSHIWCQSPQEVRIAFDRAIDPASLAGLRDKLTIEYGRHVAPGDRLENLRPGYAVVAMQMAEPRYELAVHSASLTADRRTLLVATAEHQPGMSYSLLLPTIGAFEPDADERSLIRQLPEMELGYTVQGVQVEWNSRQQAELPNPPPRTTPQPADWIGVIPHFDIAVSRELTRGSAEHDRLWDLMSLGGAGSLTTQIDFGEILRPKVQPGSKIDYTWPEEQVRLHVQAALSHRFTFGDSTVPRDAGEHKLVAAISHPGKLSASKVGITFGVHQEPITIDVSLSTNEDDRHRAIPLHRLSWQGFEAPSKDSGLATKRPEPPELRGGDWFRGRDVFFSQDALCFKCHSVRGQGGSIGPNLSNLRHRDYASVLRDVTQPSYAINPDYITYSALLHDGQTISGVVRSEGDRLRIGDAKGNEHLVPRDEVELLRPQPISTMPDNIVKTLPANKLRDLLTFLLLAPPPELEPAPINRPGAPAPRTRAEFEAALDGSERLDPAKLKELRIVFVAGPKDHGENEHDYPDWQKRWSKLFSLTPKVKVETAEVWPNAEQLQTADVLVWYSANPGWSPERAKEIDGFQARGGGMVYLHFAVNGQRAPDQLAERIGLAWGASKFRHGALDLQLETASKHPILRNFTKAHFEDESYWNLVGDPARINLLASGQEEGMPRPLMWTLERGKGRVFVSILGHYSWTFDDPVFRTLVFRGMAWTANEPVERFNELVPLGARIAE